MIPRSLHLRLLFALAVILLPAGAIWIGTSLRGARAYHQEITQRSDARLASNLLGELELSPDAQAADAVGASGADLAALVEMLAMAHPAVEIYVLNDAGRILQAPPDVAPRVSAVDLAPVHAFLAAVEEDERRFPIQGTDPRRGGRTVFSAAPFPGGGLLYVVLTDEARASLTRSVRTSTTLRLVAWGGGLGLATLLLVGAVAFSLLTRRLRKLTQEMRDVTDSWRRPSAPGSRTRAQRESGAASAARSAVGQVGDEIDVLDQGFRDLVARVRAQVRDLERADTARRELVTNVSHDLRTPLTALQGALEAMADDPSGPEGSRRERHLDTARRNAARLERLIGQLFDLARLEGPGAPLHPERFALHELVQDVVLKHAGQAEAGRVTLQVSDPGALPLVNGDLGQIERALSNVLDNAVRHTPPGGRVHVDMAADDDHLHVRIRDTGEGIAPAHLSHVFDRFYRAAPERGGHGSGLGLAITRRIVTLHGGEVDITSEVGRGTVVTLELPLEGPPGLPPSEGTEWS